MFKNYNEIKNLNNEVTEEVVPLPEQDETVETQESELVLGVVTNCVLLNIREEPNINQEAIWNYGGRRTFRPGSYPTHQFGVRNSNTARCRSCGRVPYQR